MKKLLVVAAVGVVGYYVAKKVIERKNEEVIENVEGEIVVDSDEEIEDKNVVKGMVKRVIDVPIKVNGFICDKLIRINRRLEEIGGNIRLVEYKPGIINAICCYSQASLFYLVGCYEVFNRCVALVLGLVSAGLYKLKNNI